MGNIYDGAFRTILNDCRQMIIPVINEIFKEDYTGNEIIEFHPNEHFIEQQDAANQERITDTNFIIYGKKKKKYHLECESSIAQNYENVQKGVGDIMGGALLETEARTILNRGKDEAKKETAIRMLQDGELSTEKIAKYSGLDIAEAELLARLQTV